MDQGHGAKPAGKLVHAGLTLGKMVRVSPARRPGALGLGGGNRWGEKEGKTQAVQGSERLAK